MKTNTTKIAKMLSVLLIMFVLLISTCFAVAKVTHKATDLQVEFPQAGSFTNAEGALGALWESVKTGSQTLWNNCYLVGAAPTMFGADDISAIPVSYASVTSGHHAKQVLVSIEGVTMSVQGAVVGIATEITRVKTNKVNYACRSYCNGATLVASGTCNGAGFCGAAYAAGTGTNCLDSGRTCENLADASGEANGARCRPNPANTCSGNWVYKDYRCISATDCDYRTKTDCGSLGCNVQTVTCNAPAPTSIPLDGACGPNSVNAALQCASGLTCYDSNGDGIGACREPVAPATTTTTTEVPSTGISGGGDGSSIPKNVVDTNNWLDDFLRGLIG